MKHHEIETFETIYFHSIIWFAINLIDWRQRLEIQ